MRLSGRVYSKSGGLQSKLEGLPKAVSAAAAKAVYSGALAIQRHAKVSIQAHESSGITYHHGKVSHVASKPGYPPNSDIGTLARSIEIDWNREQLTALIGTNLKYGLWLELGTVHIEPRPWLFPAFDAHVEDVRSTLVDSVNDAIRSLGRAA